MKTYDVLLSEEVLFKYTVEAESKEDAKELILSGEYDHATYRVVGSSECIIDSIIEVTE